jgi:hypothetical protein
MSESPFWRTDRELEREAQAVLGADGRKRAMFEIYARKPVGGETILFVNGQALPGVQEFTLSGTHDGLVELRLRILPESLRVVGQALTELKLGLARPTE